MHNAPAVSYPVGRSRFQAGMLALVTLLGIAGALLWFVQVEVPGWRQWSMLFGSVATGLGVWWQRRHPLTGQLTWDGLSWIWSDAKRSVPTQLAVVIDFQAAMLLCLRPDDQTRRIWVWVDRNASPTTRWLALRRAVHQYPRQVPDPLAQAQQQGAPQP
jgi:hypothetical protein